MTEVKSSVSNLTAVDNTGAYSFARLASALGLFARDTATRSYARGAAGTVTRRGGACQTAGRAVAARGASLRARIGSRSACGVTVRVVAYCLIGGIKSGLNGCR